MKILKWIGIVLGVLALVLILAGMGVYLASEAMVNQTYQAPTEMVVIVNDPRAIARGDHITHAIAACVSCHGQDFGGGVVFEDPAIGRIVAPNLTRGENGLGNTLTDGDFVRAIRYGVKPDGKSVKVMPADDYNHMSDADLAAVIAYVRSLPNVDSNLPYEELGPLGRALLVGGQLSFLVAPRIDFGKPHSAAVSEAVDAAYGKYLADTAGCTACHGPGLAGGKIPGTPPDFPQAANLTSPEVKAWTADEFVQTIRTGVDPSGHQLVDEMPWKDYRTMSNEELLAIWEFIKLAPSKAFGTR